MAENILQIQNLHTCFHTDKGILRAVDGLDLTVEKGKIIGIVGESGCGKSITAMSIMGLLQDKKKELKGSVQLEGKELLNLPEKSLAAIRGKDMSMVFQEPMTSLNPLMTVGRQVSEVLLRHGKMTKAQAREKTIEMLVKVGIPEAKKRYHSYPHQLSGGLRQRVMIAMAMICEPKLLIADEPTTALDVTIEAQILLLMRKLCDETGTSIILISHNMGVVASVCDYVYVMYAGKVMEEAPVLQLFEESRHPYTRGLLKSIPNTGDNPKRLHTIKGNVPELLDLPKGCAFCTRCEEAQQRCTEEVPSLYKAAGSKRHRVRCFLYEKESLNIEEKQEE